ncbi:flagellar assembly protein FliW [Adhaeretor mobilis]|uniref:Flagellar assembly factor FliW n=1 Tax=Adhaeretor mobilis TaxID=1930276 RepID=A0A517MTX1_9BACT|nr:flagellar assembly protein FliW [Adhaeretor mobilis]QDS98323.1 Flagellar assembly factor FliW [Adhaeretor mobilis]
MEVKTSRFGVLRVLPQDLITFEQGIVGFRELRRWCLLSDADCPTLGWLQSVDTPEVAMGIVSPRRFVPEYQLRAARQDLQDLNLQAEGDAQVVVIVSRHEEGFSLNLRAPIVVNVENRRGCQVVSRDPLPVQRLLPVPQTVLRRTA